MQYTPDLPRHDITYDRRVTLHSQVETRQDEWVIQMMRGKTHGNFLEIGCYDGVYHSNTLCLERDFGWMGWLVESNQDLVRQARRVRLAHVLCATIAPTAGLEEFFDAGLWGGLKNLMRYNLLASNVSYQNPVVTVQTSLLSQILATCCAPPVIDYLSIDVEGAEYLILKQYFESKPKTHFRCMTVEVGSMHDDLDALTKLLTPFGYRLDMVQAWEAYFYNPRFM